MNDLLLKRAQSIFRFMILALSLFCLPVDANAQSEEPEVSFAVMELVPYGMVSKDGKTTGYFFESALALLKKSGLTHKIGLFPLKRLAREILDGREDCMFIAETHYTKKNFRLIEPLGKDIPVGILPEAGKDIDRYEDLASHSIGVPIGVLFNQRFENDATLNKTTTVDYSSSVEMLVRKRVTAIAGNIDSFRYFAAKSGRNPDEIFGRPLIFDHIPIWLGCGLTTPDDRIVERLAASMRTLHDNGTFQAIIDKYK